jgi:hypothetical protein
MRSRNSLLLLRPRQATFLLSIAEMCGGMHTPVHTSTTEKCPFAGGSDSCRAH